MIRTMRWIRRVHAARGQRGQAAVMFLALMALILVLAASTMNIGEVAKLKTGTANAADAGALAGASWVASADNEIADIVPGMLLNIAIVMALFGFPFCWSNCQLLPWTFALALTITNFGILKILTADMISHAAWDNAQAAALFTAVQNLQIDDQSGQVQEQIQSWSQQFEDNQSVPNPATLSWSRTGGDGVARQSSVSISVDMGSGPPMLQVMPIPMVKWCWDQGTTSGGNCAKPSSSCYEALCCGPCITTPYGNYCAPYCMPMSAWMSGQAQTAQSGAQTAVQQGVAMFMKWFGSIPLPRPGVCMACPWPSITGFIPVLAVALPTDISDSDGQVTVTITQHREGGSNLGFWTMQYPDQLVSSATAEYSGGGLTGGASARLVSVQ